MFLYKHSFGNNLLTSFRLCTDVRELSSRDWQVSWSPTGCPWVTNLSPCPGPSAPLGFWVPWLPQARLCSEAALPTLSPMLLTALIQISYLLPSVHFSSRTPPSIQKANPPHHQPWMPLVVDSASQNIWKWSRKKNATPTMSQNLFSRHVQEAEKAVFPLYSL